MFRKSVTEIHGRVRQKPYLVWTRPIERGKKSLGPRVNPTQQYQAPNNSTQPHNLNQTRPQRPHPTQVKLSLTKPCAYTYPLHKKIRPAVVLPPQTYRPRPSAGHDRPKNTVWAFFRFFSDFNSQSSSTKLCFYRLYGKRHLRSITPRFPSRRGGRGREPRCWKVRLPKK